MKDDFYKDMEHTRREQKNKSDNRKRRRTKVDPELSRSARYKEEGKKQSSTENTSKKSVKNTPSKKTKKQTSDKKTASASFTSLANNAKKYLLTTRDKYQKQLGSEFNESKSKLKNLKKSAFAGLKSPGNNKKWKAIFLLILAPIAIFLAFLIISNFWPADKDYKGETNETTTVEAVDKRKINKEFEEKKAELEKEFAERDKDSSSSNETEDSQSKTEKASREYTEEEKESMKKEADKAIEEKKKTDTESSADESKMNKSNDTDSAEEDGADKDNKVGATHIVTSTDNLYRIAIQYYGSGSEENLEKIREANGISGNNLSVGQELIIP